MNRFLNVQESVPRGDDETRFLPNFDSRKLKTGDLGRDQAALSPGAREREVEFLDQELHCPGQLMPSPAENFTPLEVEKSVGFDDQVPFCFVPVGAGGAAGVAGGVANREDLLSILAAKDGADKISW